MPLLKVIRQEQHESPITVDEGDDDQEKQRTTDVTEESTENRYKISLILSFTWIL
jgi:hypothetical protein